MTDNTFTLSNKFLIGVAGSVVVLYLVYRSLMKQFNLAHADEDEDDALEILETGKSMDDNAREKLLNARTVRKAKVNTILHVCVCGFHIENLFFKF